MYQTMLRSLSHPEPSFVWLEPEPKKKIGSGAPTFPFVTNLIGRRVSWLQTENLFSMSADPDTQLITETSEPVSSLPLYHSQRRRI